MRLTTRLVAVLMLGLICLVAINGMISLKRTNDVFRRVAKTHAQHLGDELEEMILVVWEKNGGDSAIEMIRTATDGRHHMQVRWVWFDASPGDPFSPSAPPDLLQALIIKNHLPVEVQRPNGPNLLNHYWEIDVQDERRGGLEMSEPMDVLEDEKRAVLTRTLLQMLCSVAVCGVLTVVTGVRMVGRPLEMLIEKTRRVGAGDLERPLQLQANHELGELATSLNDMCRSLAESQEKVQQEAAAKIVALDQLQHSDRLQTVGRLASGMAHELGTPLAVVAGRANLIASGKLSSDDVIKSAGEIKNQADQITTIIRRLLDFARSRTPKRASVDLRQVVEQSIGMVSWTAESHDIAISAAEGDGPLMASVDVGQIQQVLTNLLVNAGQAMPDGGSIDVVILRQHVCPPTGVDAQDGVYFRIDVRDTGAGITAQDIEHVFEPFFTTKKVGEGTGLGLSISYGIVREHGGWIDVASEPGTGTCFSIYLPEETSERNGDSGKSQSP